jgi:hypothetical protein
MTSSIAAEQRGRRERHDRARAPRRRADGVRAGAAAHAGQDQALILPDLSFALPLTIWILTSFFAAMPWDLEKAAPADGATPAQAFRQILLPLAAPGLFTLRSWRPERS